jgi:hypothetical protein
MSMVLTKYQWVSSIFCFPFWLNIFAYAKMLLWNNLTFGKFHFLETDGGPFLIANPSWQWSPLYYLYFGL